MGEIEDINLVREKGTNKSQGFAFVKYEDQRSTILAVDNFNRIDILQRTIRVDHVDQYKLPKEVREREEELLDENPDANVDIGPGHAYKAQELLNEYSIGRGVDHWAKPASTSTPAALPTATLSSTVDNEYQRDKGSKKKKQKELKHKEHKHKHNHKEHKKDAMKKKHKRHARSSDDEDDNHSKDLKRHKKEKEREKEKDVHPQQRHDDTVAFAPAREPTSPSFAGELRESRHSRHSVLALSIGTQSRQCSDSHLLLLSALCNDVTLS